MTKINVLGSEKSRLLFCVVMEYEKGGSLKDEIRFKLKNDKDKLYEKEEIFRIVQDVTSGLCYLLSKGLMHCDVSPHNILISKCRRMKLCDLESLKEIDYLTHTKMVGHRGYMSPELHLQNGINPENIDIWSLGMTILQILFPKYEIEKINMHRSELINEIQTFDKDLYQIIDQCLKEDPNERISSFELNKFVNLNILKDFFAIIDFQYCFITNLDGKIIVSKYSDDYYKSIEKEIETELINIMKRETKVNFCFQF